MHSHGLLVPHDPDQAAQAVLQLSQSPARLAALAAACVNGARRYDVSVAVEHLIRTLHHHRHNLRAEPSWVRLSQSEPRGVRFPLRRNDYPVLA